MIHRRPPRVLRHRIATTRRSATNLASVALVASALLTGTLAASGCAPDDGSARQAPGSDAPPGAGDAAQPSSQAGDGDGSTGGARVIAGLGAPLARLVDRAGLPGLGVTSTNGVSVSPEQQACLEREASALPPQDLRVVTAGGGLGELTPTGGTILATSIDRCLDAAFLGERLGEEYVIGLGADATLDPGFAPCIAGELTDGTGALVTEVAREGSTATTDTPQAVTEVVDPCGATHLEKLLTDHYGGQGLDGEVASCVGLGLSERVSLSEVLDRGNVANLEAEFSPTLQLDLEDLLEQCGAPPRAG